MQITRKLWFLLFSFVWDDNSLPVNTQFITRSGNFWVPGLSLVSRKFQV